MCNHPFSAPKQSISSAIFLIGLAMLFALDWFWPGILVLVAITTLLEAGMRRWLPDSDEIPLRVDNPEGASPPARLVYPARCQSCGAATPETIQAPKEKNKVVCSYCGSQLQSTAEFTHT